MNSTIQLSQFRKLVDGVLAAMLQGKRVTKSELNNLIPEGMNKSADDIIRRLHEIAPVKISHKRKKDGEPPYWYIASADIQAYLHSPEDYLESLLQQKEEASRKKARSNINAAKSRFGVAFVVDEAEAN